MTLRAMVVDDRRDVFRKGRRGEARRLGVPNAVAGCDDGDGETGEHHRKHTLHAPPFWLRNRQILAHFAGQSGETIVSDVMFSRLTGVALLRRPLMSTECPRCEARSKTV